MKKIETMAFLVEPSSYTLDLVEHLYKPMGIEYTFLHKSPLIARAEKNLDAPILADYSWIKKIEYLLRIRKRYDLIIFNGYNYPEFLFLFFMNLISSDKKVIAIESDTQAKPDRGVKGLLKRLFLGSVFKSPYILGFSGGGYVHKDLFRKYGMDEERIFLMPMMVNNEKFRRPADQKHTPKNPFVFLYVGRIIPHKNVEMLIKSFMAAFKEQDDVTLRIVGRGESLDELKKAYKDVSNIRFEGAKFADDLVKTYHTSHVLVIPSLYEPWGLVVNEAMAAGLPVLASSRVGAIYDLIEKRETGFVFDPENIEELVSLMQKVYKEKGLYEKLSSNAAATMSQYWNYDLYRENLLKAIEYAGQKVNGAIS